MPAFRLSHLLLIDDDPDDFDVFREALEQIDPQLHLHQASSWAQATAVLEQVTPELIFLDISMPKVNGFECLVNLKDHFSGIPVVMYSSTVLPQDIQLSYNMGAALFFRKPYSYLGLVASLQGILQLPWLTPEIVRQQHFVHGKYIPFSLGSAENG